MKTPAVFVGREIEIKTAVALIRKGKSLVIEGPFGIGKTTFAAKVATSIDGFLPLYCSFEHDGSKIVEGLNREIIPLYRRNNSKLGKQIHSFHLATQEKRPLIIVDDIWKVTPQKVAFFKRLNKYGNCQFILIIETTKDNLRLKVRTIDTNHEIIKLGKLNDTDSYALFDELIARSDRTVAQGVKHALVESCNGYPLGIVETVRITRGLA